MLDRAPPPPPPPRSFGVWNRGAKSGPVQDPWGSLRTLVPLPCKQQRRWAHPLVPTETQRHRHCLLPLSSAPTPLRSLWSLCPSPQVQIECGRPPHSEACKNLMNVENLTERALPDGDLNAWRLRIRAEMFHHYACVRKSQVWVVGRVGFPPPPRGLFLGPGLALAS